MTSLQYYCILGLAGTHRNKNLCAKDAGCAGNKITEQTCAVLPEPLLLIHLKRGHLQEVPKSHMLSHITLT